MDMYSKMDGSTPVSQALGSIWGVQKKGKIDDQHTRNGKEGKKKEEKEEEKEGFEDGWVHEEHEMTSDAGKKNGEEDAVVDRPEDKESDGKKIDIVI